MTKRCRSLTPEQATLFLDVLRPRWHNYTGRLWQLPNCTQSELSYLATLGLVEVEPNVPTDACPAGYRLTAYGMFGLIARKEPEKLQFVTTGGDSLCTTRSLEETLEYINDPDCHSDDWENYDRSDAEELFNALVDALSGSDEKLAYIMVKGCNIVLPAESLVIDKI